MNQQRAFEIVAQAIAEEFRIDAATVMLDTVAGDVAGWDSFSHGSLIMGLEAKLNVVLPIDDLLEAANVGELVAIVARSVR
jgi:acyl carrier protein